MAENKKVVLTVIAKQQLTDIHQSLIDGGAFDDAEIFMDDFLDLAFSTIPSYPEKFTPIEGVSNDESDYRLASLFEDFRIIFQILKGKILILLILHENELPF
ncbi:MAG: hypothetical protein AAFY71_02415 [Bacteroidota bacterium]